MTDVMMPALSDKCGLCTKECKRNSEDSMTLQCQCCMKSRLVHTACLRGFSSKMYSKTVQNNSELSDLFSVDNGKMVFFCNECNFKKCMLCRREHNMCLKNMKFVRFEKDNAPHWTYSRCFPYDDNVQLLQKGTRVFCAKAKKDDDYFTVERIENNGHVIHILLKLIFLGSPPHLGNQAYMKTV